jgi:soluble lytic murein transglycosylase-like protein
VPNSTDNTSEYCQVSNQYPEKILQWCSLITHYSNKRGLNPDLIAALIWQESGGNPVAYSKSGAVGLMQVMPRDGLAATFMCVNGPCFKNRPTIAELNDPEFNISYGTKMLSGLLVKNGNIRNALKAYGPMDTGYYYADKVLGIYESYRSQ